MTDYPDTNGNGIPDAFENRPSIREILNPETVRAENRLESRDYTEAGEYAYLIHGQNLFGKGVVLMEIRDVLNRCSAACLFRSPQELTVFLDKLQEAANNAFGQESVANR